MKVTKRKKNRKKTELNKRSIQAFEELFSLTKNKIVRLFEMFLNIPKQ